MANADTYQADKTILIVPLLSGSGIRVKIIEAMAMGKAIISTSKGAEGLNCTDKKNILIADSAVEFAAAIQWLFNHPKECRKLGNAAREFAEEEFGLKKVGAKKVTFYKKLLLQNSI